MQRSRSESKESQFFTVADHADISHWLFRDLREIESKIAAGKKINVQEYKGAMKILNKKLREIGLHMIVSIEDLDNPLSAISLSGRLDDAVQKKVHEHMKADHSVDRNIIKQRVRKELLEEYRKTYSLPASHTDYEHFLSNMYSLVKHDILSRKSEKEAFIAMERWVRLLKDAWGQHDFLNFSIIHGALSSIEVERLHKKGRLSDQAEEFLEKIETDKVLRSLAVIQANLVSQGVTIIPEFGSHKRAITAASESADKSQVGELARTFQGQQKQNKKELKNSLFHKEYAVQQLLIKDHKKAMLDHTMASFGLDDIEQYLEKYIEKYEKNHENKKDKKQKKSNEKAEISQKRYEIAILANQMVKKIKSEMHVFSLNFPNHDKLIEFENYVREELAKLKGILEQEVALRKHMSGHTFKSAIKSTVGLADRLQELESVLKRLGQFISEEMDDLSIAQTIRIEFQAFEKKGQAVKGKEKEKTNKHKHEIKLTKLSISNLPSHRSQRDMHSNPLSSVRGAARKRSPSEPSYSPRTPTPRSPRMEKSIHTFNMFQTTGHLATMEDQSPSSSKENTPRREEVAPSPRAPKSSRLTPRTPRTDRPGSGLTEVRSEVSKERSAIRKRAGTAIESRTTMFDLTQTSDVTTSNRKLKGEVEPKEKKKKKKKQRDSDIGLSTHSKFGGVRKKHREKEGKSETEKKPTPRGN